MAKIRKASALLLDKRGFSLVELLIALAVFAFGVLGVIGMQMYAIHGNAFAWNLTLAESVAQQKIEYYKNFGYSTIKELNFGTSYTDQAAVPVSDLPAADRLSTGGNNVFEGSTGVNTYNIDVEGYGALMSAVGTIYEDSINNTTGASGADGIPDPPYDRFRRVTIMKVIDGLATDGVPDCVIVIKVLVYWTDTSGVERKVSMMTTKALGG